MSSPSDGSSSGRWLDDAAGPVVRPYAMTRGRTRTGQALDLVALVVTTRQSVPPRSGYQPEHQRILEACRWPLSVAEVSAHVDLPLGVVRVLIGDLIEAGCVIVKAAPTVTELHSKRVLEAVIDGLRAI